LQYDTASMRNPAASLRMAVIRPGEVIPPWSERAACSVICLVSGRGVPLVSNHPMPPPWSQTKRGAAAVADDPTFVPTTNVWYPLMLHG
jgi:hypothetical protein